MVGQVGVDLDDGGDVVLYHHSFGAFHGTGGAGAWRRGGLPSLITTRGRTTLWTLAVVVIIAKRQKLLSCGGGGGGGGSRAIRGDGIREDWLVIVCTTHS